MFPTDQSGVASQRHLRVVVHCVELGHKLLSLHASLAGSGATAPLICV
jgi:hypothetical protein